jgi:hypothetical protein
MPVDQDHSDLVKFGADDPDCQVIIDYIHHIAKITEQLSSPKRGTVNSHCTSPSGAEDDVIGW